MTEAYTSGGPSFGSESTAAFRGPWQQQHQSHFSRPAERHDDGVDSKWIHRDNLAQIESQELAEIGIQLGFADRMIPGGSTTSPTFSHGRTASNGEIPEEAKMLVDTQLPSAKRLRTTSGSVSVNDNHDQSYVWHTQLDGSLQYTPSPPIVKKSKIPISKSSPASKTNTTTNMEPDIYPTRKGSIKNARNSLERVTNQKLRKPSASTAGSDYVDPPTQPGSAQIEPSTPPPSSTRRNSMPTPKNRSVSDGSRLPRSGRVVTGVERARNVSAPFKPASPIRPATSGGPRQPINRPEGDAPWIATMFKPDPRLPQEEQIIPTHAKRLAMEHGYIAPDIEPSTLDPPISTESPESNNVPLELDNLDHQAQSTEDELSARSRTSLRNRFRRDTSRSRHSQEHSLAMERGESTESLRQNFAELNFPEEHFQKSYNVEQHNRDPSVVEKQTQDEEWPLRSSSTATAEDHFTTSQVEKSLQPELGTATIPPHEPIVIENNEKVQRAELPHAVTSLPPASTKSVPKIIRVPETSDDEKRKKKNSSCACCIVM